MIAVALSTHISPLKFLVSQFPCSDLEISPHGSFVLVNAYAFGLILLALYNVCPCANDKVPKRGCLSTIHTKRTCSEIEKNPYAIPMALVQRCYVAQMVKQLTTHQKILRSSPSPKSMIPLQKLFMLEKTYHCGYPFGFQ